MRFYTPIHWLLASSKWIFCTRIYQYYICVCDMLSLCCIMQEDSEGSLLSRSYYMIVIFYVFKNTGCSMNSLMILIFAWNLNDLMIILCLEWVEWILKCNFVRIRGGLYCGCAISSVKHSPYWYQVPSRRFCALCLTLPDCQALVLVCVYLPFHTSNGQILGHLEFQETLDELEGFIDSYACSSWRDQFRL